MDKRTQLYWRLKDAAEAEIAENIQNHKMRTERIRSGLAHRKAPGAKVQKLPLDFLAIGDSWFEYPLNGNDVAFPPIQNYAIAAKSQLGSIGNPPPRILNLAVHGQATTAVLSYKKQQELLGVLQDKSQWTNPKTHLPDAILISAGGDDIVGDQFAVYLNYGGGGLNGDRFQGVLDSVKASYFDLFAFRDIFAKEVPVIGHCYDYAIPNGVHPVCVAEGWLQPSLEFAGYGYSAGAAIVHAAIDGFYDMLHLLATDQILPKGKKTNNFMVVDTRNTLSANASRPNGWGNEIHPYPDGFGALANKFLTSLRGKFPGRI